MTTTTALPTVLPMLASPQGRNTLSTLVGSHVFDTKLDGIRCLLYIDAGCRVTLRNRNGVDITHRYPEVVDAITDLRLPPLILDGEIVALSGSFQDTAKRDKQNNPLDVKVSARAIPVAFIAFDVLWLGTQDLRPLPYESRRQMLDDLILPSSLWSATLSTSVVSEEVGFFDTIKAMGMEGVIAKRKDSTYKGGRFSDWVKFKATRSITAIGIGYERGTGARADFGAMFLALVSDKADVVEIGRVGTGFKAADIREVKAELDAGRVVVVEIECLNKSKSGQLRFPVYKGIRSDLTVADAVLSQLDELPTM